MRKVLVERQRRWCLRGLFFFFFFFVFCFVTQHRPKRDGKPGGPSRKCYFNIFNEPPPVVIWTVSLSATVGALCGGQSERNYKQVKTNFPAVVAVFRPVPPTNWRTFGRQAEDRKGTPSQRDRQQTGTAKGRCGYRVTGTI